MTALLHIIILIFLIVNPCNSNAKREYVATAYKSNNHSNQVQKDTSREKERKPRTRTLKVWATAYSSTVDQTDSTPFKTSLGTRTRRGIVATNLLPFGTKIQIPSEFGNKIFTVEDRMPSDKQEHVDVWMPSRRAANRFGKKRTHIIVLVESKNDKNL